MKKQKRLYLLFSQSFWFCILAIRKNIFKSREDNRLYGNLSYNGDRS